MGSNQHGPVDQAGVACLTTTSPSSLLFLGFICPRQGGKRKAGPVETNKPLGTSTHCFAPKHDSARQWLGKHVCVVLYLITPSLLTTHPNRRTSAQKEKKKGEKKKAKPKTSAAKAELATLRSSLGTMQCMQCKSHSQTTDTIVGAQRHHRLGNAVRAIHSTAQHSISRWSIGCFPPCRTKPSAPPSPDSDTLNEYCTMNSGPLVGGLAKLSLCFSDEA